MDASQTPGDLPSPLAPAPPLRNGLLMFLVAFACVATLYLAREVILPIALAVMLAFALNPFVNLLRRLRLGRVLSVLLAVVTAVSIIASLATMMAFQIGQIAEELPLYEATIEEKVDSLRAGVLGRASRIAENLGRQIERATETPPEGADAAPAAAPAPDERAKPVPVEVREPDLTPAQMLQRVLVPTLQPLATIAITFVVLIFILMQREDLRDRLIRLMGSRDLHRTTEAMDEAAYRLSRFFLTQVLLSTAYGVITALVLWSIGVPSPLLAGLVAALMRFVPYIGSVIAAALPLLLAVAVDPGWTTALMTLAYFVLAEPFMGYVVEPIAFGQTTGLSPFAVVVAAIFWSWLWGPVGLIIAMPLTLCLVVLGRHVERFEFLDVILGDRPPLTPAENLYQRLLADDPDEALESAEQLLKERSIAEYYDEVAIRGLRLAADDAARGLLRAEKIQTVDEAMKSMVGDLATLGLDAARRQATRNSETEEPPVEEAPEAWGEPGSVLCVAGRGAFDDAAATLLADLLTRRGFGAAKITYAAVSRANLPELRTQGVRLACVIQVEANGAPAHARYLLKRLRSALPNRPVLAGLWPEHDQIFQDEELRQRLGADRCTTSLRETLQTCLQIAREAEPTESVAPAAPVAGKNSAAIDAAE